MKIVFEKFVTISNALTPFVVIIFLYFAHNNYVKQDEYLKVKDDIFNRLDHIEQLMYRIINKTNNIEYTGINESSNN